MAFASVILTLVAIPRQVIWPYSVSGLVFLIGLGGLFLRGEWSRARGLQKLILFGPLFYAAPIAAFGTEHYMIPDIIASLIPAWIPWHSFWTYFVGTGLILAGLSMVTKIQARLAAGMIGLMFFLFVVLMDIPGWLSNPRDRFALALALRELAFSGGALALAGSLADQGRERGTHFLVALGRYFVAIPVLFYSFEQFLHADYVPGIPLNRLTPAWIPGRTLWTYLTAAVYAVAGILLLLRKKTRSAATWLGLTVLLVEMIVYVPIGVVDRASLVGLNYLEDTLMFCGTVLLLAGAMPNANQQAAPELSATEGKAPA